jgi:tetratricopeptide (TPR) repeat protein
MRLKFPKTYAALLRKQSEMPAEIDEAFINSRTEPSSMFGIGPPPVSSDEDIVNWSIYHLKQRRRQHTFLLLRREIEREGQDKEAMAELWDEDQVQIHPRSFMLLDMLKSMCRLAQTEVNKAEAYCRAELLCALRGEPCLEMGSVLSRMFHLHRIAGRFYNGSGYHRVFMFEFFFNMLSDMTAAVWSLSLEQYDAVNLATIIFILTRKEDPIPINSAVLSPLLSVTREAMCFLHPIPEWSPLQRLVYDIIFAEISGAECARVDERFEELVHKERSIRNPLLKHISVYLYAALYALQREQTDKAVDLLTEAIAQDSNFCEAHYRLAMIHQQCGNREVALEHYNHVLRLNPQHRGAEKHISELSDRVEGEGSTVGFQTKRPRTSSRESKFG